MSEARSLPELVGELQAELKRKDFSPAGQVAFDEKSAAIRQALVELADARREVAALVAEADHAAPVMSPAWRLRALADWPPGVPGVRREARSARVATLLEPVGCVFLAPPGDVQQPHPDGVRIVVAMTWQEAVQVAATHAFSGVTMDEVLLAMLAADVSVIRRRVG